MINQVDVEIQARLAIEHNDASGFYSFVKDNTAQWLNSNSNIFSILPLIENDDKSGLLIKATILVGVKDPVTNVHNTHVAGCYRNVNGQIVSI